MLRPICDRCPANAAASVSERLPLASRLPNPQPERTPTAGRWRLGSVIEAQSRSSTGALAEGDSFESGGPMLLGHEERIRSEMVAFLEEYSSNRP